MTSIGLSAEGNDGTDKIDRLAASIATLHIVVQALIKASPDKERLSRSFKNRVEIETAAMLGRAVPESYLDEVTAMLDMYEIMITDRSA